VSVSPNPEYPICETIDTAGRFGINYLADYHGDLVAKFRNIDRDERAKLQAVGLAYHRTPNGVILLDDSIRSLECKVVKAWSSGDHRTYVGLVLSERAPDRMRSVAPRRFDGSPSALKRLAKQFGCRSHLYDLLLAVRSLLSPPGSIAEGTMRYLANGESHSLERSGDP
jgi:flavin reductase (DIM6/NTAB) family NADH-FMN oxidoreductase RutF